MRICSNDSLALWKNYNKWVYNIGKQIKLGKKRQYILTFKTLEHATVTSAWFGVVLTFLYLNKT